MKTEKEDLTGQMNLFEMLSGDTDQTEQPGRDETPEEEKEPETGDFYPIHRKADEMHVVMHKIFEDMLEKEKIAKIEKRLDLPEFVRCPVRAGDVLGRVIYECGGEVVGAADIKAENDIDAIGFFGLFSRILGGFCLKG